MSMYETDGMIGLSVSFTACILWNNNDCATPEYTKSVIYASRCRRYHFSDQTVRTPALLAIVRPLIVQFVQYVGRNVSSENS